MPLTGCQSPRHFASTPTLRAGAPISDRLSANPSILVMPIDATLFKLTAGGMLEPQAEWTRAAVQHLRTALSRSTALRGKRLVDWVPPAADDPDIPLVNEVSHLHRAVGDAIIAHKVAMTLPTKRGVFDWSLGPEVSVLSRHQPADYALFLFIRDSYSTTGRLVAQILVGMLGGSMSGGEQVGFASLVDLQTGAVVWFNYLQRETGDLRGANAAEASLAQLLKGIPQ